MTVHTTGYINFTRELLIERNHDEIKFAIMEVIQWKVSGEEFSIPCHECQSMPSRECLLMKDGKLVLKLARIANRAVLWYPMRPSTVVLAR